MTSGFVSVADEIRRRLEHLSNLDTKWVNHTPTDDGESCLMYDFVRLKIDGFPMLGDAFSPEVMEWMDYVANREHGVSSINFNDKQARSREDVLLFLKKALVEVEELGL